MPEPNEKRSSRRTGAEPTAWLKPFDPELARGEQAAIRGKMVEYGIVAFVVVFLAGYEWLRWLIEAPMHPMLMTSFAACIAAYCLARIFLFRPQLLAIKADRQLWRMMTVDFAKLGERGFYLFDGLADTNRMALGPVLVGPTGVFSLTIRTNPPTGQPFERINHLDAETLRLGKRPAFADPLGQARGAALRLERFLTARGLPGVSVIPVLVFPGWRIGRQPDPSERDVVVASEKTLFSEIVAKPASLEPKGILNVCEILRVSA